MGVKIKSGSTVSSSSVQLFEDRYLVGLLLLSTTQRHVDAQRLSRFSTSELNPTSYLHSHEFGERTTACHDNVQQAALARYKPSKVFGTHIRPAMDRQQPRWRTNPCRRSFKETQAPTLIGQSWVAGDKAASPQTPLRVRLPSSSSSPIYRIAGPTG
ncbi:hypothetical protein TWF730_005716 [Orbilia blumenaviensis]|uniref:Uncharacterized protein n=1 Tax=Orbilia blumenaviensis TaxID=1796055 RepID=A0AAV9VME1_9PEZI